MQGGLLAHNKHAFTQKFSVSVYRCSPVALVCTVCHQVNIVLEYCDWGCLRDALDVGAFYTDGCLNYSAILDTAADVAKAMLHLHCNQVSWQSSTEGSILCCLLHMIADTVVVDTVYRRVWQFFAPPTHNQH